jgi:hypothetical protein
MTEPAHPIESGERGESGENSSEKTPYDKGEYNDPRVFESRLSVPHTPHPRARPSRTDPPM